MLATDTLFGLDGVAKIWPQDAFDLLPAFPAQNSQGWQSLILVMTGSKVTDVSRFKRVWGSATLRPVSASIALNCNLRKKHYHHMHTNAPLMFILLPGTQCPSESWLLYFSFNIFGEVLGKPLRCLPDGRLLSSSIFACSILILQALQKKAPPSPKNYEFHG